MRRRQGAEQQIHKAVIAHLRARGAPGAVFQHPANGGAWSTVEGAIFKSLGVSPGAPDSPEGQSQAYALELKADGGRVRDAAQAGRGGRYRGHLPGVDAAIATLEG